MRFSLKAMKSLRPRVKTRRKLFGNTAFRGLLLLIVIGIMLFGLSSSLRSTLHTVALPLWKGGAYVGSTIAGVFDLFRSKNALVLENERLKAEFAELSIRLLDRNELYEENLALKERLGRDASVNAVLAAVVARPPRAPYDTLLLDAGSRDGVSVGDFVAASETLIIGAIEHVTLTTSIARLYSAPGVVTEVTLGHSGPVLQAVGQGAGNFEARVPVGIEVLAGESVLLPTIVPHVFAVVEYVRFNPTDSSRSVFFRSPVNPFELRFVTVLRQSE